MKKENKCSWEPKQGTFCFGMTQTLNREANRGKGFYVLRLTNMQVPNKPMDFIAGIVFANKDFPDGLLINFCPWCGERMGQRGEKGELIENAVQGQDKRDSRQAVTVPKDNGA